MRKALWAGSRNGGLCAWAPTLSKVAVGQLYCRRDTEWTQEGQGSWLRSVAQYMSGGAGPWHMRHMEDEETDGMSERVRYNNGRAIESPLS